MKITRKHLRRLIYESASPGTSMKDVFEKINALINRISKIEEQQKIFKEFMAEEMQKRNQEKN